MAVMGNLLKDIRKGRENRSLYLRGILPYLFALGCARAWVTLAVAAPALALPAAFDLHDIFDYAFCLISIAVALAARRLLPLNATGWMRAASAALMVAASLCLIAVGIGLVAGPAAIALVAAGAAAGGAGFGLFLLLWAEVLSCISLICIFLYTTAIVMAVLFASAYFFSNRFNIGTLYRSPLVLIVCGFLLVPVEGVFGTAASSYLISMSYSLVGIIVALLLYDISKRLGVTVVIFAAIKGAEQVFVIWGKGVAEAMVAAGMNAGAQDAVIAVAVVAMMLAATLILLSEKELASRWGVRILDAGGLVEKTPEELRRDERAAELAEHARLTPRETEILALVAQGKNGPAIMQELFIAEGTFKAHMSHIYEKCGVANRRELVALLGA